MNGLNLETFLRLIRADMGVWASLGVIAMILGVMTWTSWGSRRALRKCLFLSIAAHLGLIVYGSTSPLVLKIFRLDSMARQADRPDRPVRVTPWVAESSATGPDGRPAPKIAGWDLERSPLAMADPGRLASPTDSAPPPILSRAEPPPIAPETAAPDVRSPSPPPIEAPASAEARSVELSPTVAPGDPLEVAPSVAAVGGLPDVPAPSANRVRPDPVPPGSARQPADRPGPIRPSLPQVPEIDVPTPRVATPGLSPGERLSATSTIPGGEVTPTSPEELDPGPPVEALTPSPSGTIAGPEVRRAPRPSRADISGTPSRTADGSNPIAMARVTPTSPSSLSSLSKPEIRRSLTEVPPVYRSRLDPNRTVLAQRAGASVASEQAVELALDWLARHQDATDGRWDGGTAKTRDGGVAENDDSFTIHCPAGEVCFGECIYWEADTALTGLSLLAYLGAGYTHVEGKYAPVVGKGLDFLLKSQKTDGDLRGPSVAVGMYCHSMATLALCEAYALTGDARLRPAVESAVSFLIRSRSRDGMAWRYAPNAPDSDTSILGWAVMALKSARAVGQPIPPATQAGIFDWLRKISRGKDGGLALYSFEPKGTKVTPTMTAEAWACRQFLEVGGPGRASDEAAAFLLRNETDRGGFNIYYLYYGTLAMYQHGGDAWSTWNGRVRDEVVRRQRTRGHMAGSWDPDDSPYGTHGGRIYGTALATLTLEVYYRFLRLYEPSPATPVAPGPGGDAGTRRAGFEGGPPGR